MKRIGIFAALISITLLIGGFLTSSDTFSAFAKPKDEIVPNSFIVVLKDKNDIERVATEMANEHSLKVKKVYTSAISGYSAEIPQDKLDKVKNDKRVLFVSENRIVSIEAGDGLRGEYFDNSNLTTLRLTRVDPTINFNWGTGSPSSLVNKNSFSVRWTGQVLAPNTETYTFYTVTDDGVRLWVNDQLIIDRWSNQFSIERFGTISLEGGQRYNIRMEYFENSGQAVARLRWSTPTIVKQTVPQTNLFSTIVSDPSPTPSPTPTVSPTPSVSPTPTPIVIPTPTVIPSPSPTPTPTSTPLQPIPLGVARIGVNASNTGSGVTIAVIDTGVDLTHPDLAGNIVASTSCVASEPSANDGYGHGSHVAGTIAALNNSFGVVGVASESKIAAVKVLNAQGSGTWEDVICGIDWVTANAGTYNIKVANMSLGGGGSSDNNCGLTNNDALHLAICNSTAAGVTYVVSAGNSGSDASAFRPAAYDDTVITVSALLDYDGLPGGQAANDGYGPDDTFYANFNYGSVVDLGAPGINIYSTYKNGGYTAMSGTSMAAPHVSGAAALYIKSHSGATWSQVRDGLKAVGETLNNGHTDPSGLHPEPVVKTNSL